MEGENDHSHQNPTSTNALGRIDERQVDPMVDRECTDHLVTPTPSGSPVCGGCVDQVFFDHDLQGAEPPPTSSRSAEGSSSLDTTETSVKSHVEAFLSEKPAEESSAKIGLWDTSSVRFRHSGWRGIREQVHAAMIRTEQTPSRVNSFCTCGTGSWVQRRQVKLTGGFEYRIKASCCHDRLCTPCAAVRAWKLQLALKARMADARSLSFITLTLAGAGEGLADKIDRLYKGFRALRVHPIWEKCSGGVAFLEVKHSAKAGRWHPHLHLICESGYIDQGELSDAWKSITRDSFVVDIRRVKEQSQAAVYVTKYASKPLNSTFFSDSKLLDEAVVALKGRRLVFAFGTWFGEGLDLDSDSLLDEGEENEAEWENCMPLEVCIDQANGGSAFDREIIIKCGAETAWRLSLSG